jgi:hypothetical protein
MPQAKEAGNETRRPANGSQCLGRLDSLPLVIQIGNMLALNYMPKPTKQKGQNPQPLVGSWINGDEYATEVEYVVARAGDGFVVRAIDRFDGEEGAIYDTHYDSANSTLSFNVRWRSTGRFISVRLLAISPNRVSYTYTYTEKEMWFRKGTEPTPGIEPSRPRRHGLKTKTN